VGSAPTAIRVCRNTARLVDSYPLDLSTTMAFLEMADLFIGVDSCMLHAADLCRIPGVGLFGPTSHATYGFRFSKHIHCGGVGTMNSITATSVLSALEEMAKSEGL
jgi:ADP-heptose:LPS heptosyltransferase